ncbi:unnamed protein product, partial [Scytosiphon promiscuus]
ASASSLSLPTKMGDVVTQPRGSDHTMGSPFPDLGQPAGAPTKMVAKSLGGGHLETELAETPCHGRRASRGVGTPPAKHGGGGGSGSVLVVKPQGLPGVHVGETASGDYPVKGVPNVASSRPRSPSTESDTAGPTRTRGPAGGGGAAGGRNRDKVLATAASNADTVVDVSPQRDQRQQQQQQQLEAEQEFQRMDIKRVESSAESVVDVWAPSLGVAATSSNQRGVYDTAGEGQVTLHHSRPASRRANLSGLAEMFAATGAGGDGGAGAGVFADGEGEEGNSWGSRPSSKRVSLSRFSHLFGGVGGAGGAARAAPGESDGKKFGDFDTANPLYESPSGGRAPAVEEEDDTVRLGRPVSGRGNIPNFGTVGGPGSSASTHSDGGSSAAGHPSAFHDTMNPVHGPVMQYASDSDLDNAHGDSGCGSPSITASPAPAVDLSKPISLDGLRFERESTSSDSSSSSSSSAGDDGQGGEGVDGDHGDDESGSVGLGGVAATDADTPAAAAAPPCADSPSRSASTSDTEEGASWSDPGSRSSSTIANSSSGGISDGDDHAPDDGTSSPVALQGPLAAGAVASRSSAVVTAGATDAAAATAADTTGVPTAAVAAASDIAADNRISPFDVDNAALWARAAAAADAADAAADSDRRSSHFSISDRHSFPSHRRSLSGSSKASVASATEQGITAKLRRAASSVGILHVSTSSRVFPLSRNSRRMSADSIMLPPAPHSAALVSSHPLALTKLENPEYRVPTSPPAKQAGGRDGGLDPADKGKGRAPAFGGDFFLGKTPLVSPLGSTASTVADNSAPSTPAESVARARVEVEGDIEEGGTRPASDASGASATVAATAAATATAVEAATAAATATEAQQEVLPCAPSDEEKIIYRNTGRAGLVTCALLSFVTLTWGMWLFTIVTPAFYWFGAPAIFIIFYTACHYLGVAIWGRDFRLKEHAEVVRRSEEKGYQPTVDVFLPVCKEPLHLLANTWKHVSALEYYPGVAVKVYVLDDGASEEVRELAGTFGFEYVLRDNAPELKKAGNLRNAFGRTTGDAIAIFDADFCPRTDFLKETVPYLGEDPTIGIVQTPQFFRHRKEQTWIEQGAGVSQEFFYRMVQMNQDKFNAAVCVGSCGLYRRAALEPLGGMAAIEHSEDMYTGYKMTEHGFKIKYVPLALAMGICPDEPQSFFMQQYRWCKGSATLVQEKEFWQSGISKLHKLCFLNGMLYYMATALVRARVRVCVCLCLLV